MKKRKKNPGLSVTAKLISEYRICNKNHVKKRAGNHEVILRGTVYVHITEFELKQVVIIIVSSYKKRYA